MTCSLIRRIVSVNRRLPCVNQKTRSRNDSTSWRSSKIRSSYSTLLHNANVSIVMCLSLFFLLLTNILLHSFPFEMYVSMDVSMDDRGGQEYGREDEHEVVSIR